MLFINWLCIVMTNIIHNALMFQNRALNLDLIKRRLDRCLYKRLDLFQRDIFSVLERARNLSRTDSQIFEDSCELQKHFIKIRDEVSLFPTTSEKIALKGIYNTVLIISNS